ncbi:MAG: hypothetical protein ACTS4V_01015 [Candidatus Hodgkinia cicadicola]
MKRNGRRDLEVSFTEIWNGTRWAASFTSEMLKRKAAERFKGTGRREC